MTREEAKQIFLSRGYVEVEGGIIYDPDKWRESCRVISEWLEQEPCDDVTAFKEEVLDAISRVGLFKSDTKEVQTVAECLRAVEALSPVTPEQKIGHCKDCKYFEYDSMAIVNEIPLIVAHEICKRWGDGCKTKEDGYCFLYEPKESEVEKK